MFEIPRSITIELGRLFKDFLWNRGEKRRGRAKVAWKDICRPKDQGGLGLRDLGKLNELFLIKHIWNLITDKDTIWVEWIKTIRLKGKSFWEVGQCRQASWMWNHLLELRETVRNSIWVKIGDGRNVSIWQDKWCSEGPLCKFLSNRDIYSAQLLLLVI